MATYKHDYTQANIHASDGIGVYVAVQHNKNIDSPHVTVWRKQSGLSFLENNPKVRQIDANETRVYVGNMGAAFAIEVRVSD